MEKEERGKWTHCLRGGLFVTTMEQMPQSKYSVCARKTLTSPGYVQADTDGRKITDLVLFIFSFQISLFFFPCVQLHWNMCGKGSSFTSWSQIWRNEKRCLCSPVLVKRSLISAKPLPCPLPCLHSWHPPCPMASCFWHAPAPLWYYFLASESRELGGCGMLGVKINSGNIYTFSTGIFPWGKGISKQLQFTVFYCDKRF